MSSFWDLLVFVAEVAIGLFVVLPVVVYIVVKTSVFSYLLAVQSFEKHKKKDENKKTNGRIN